MDLCLPDPILTTIFQVLIDCSDYKSQLAAIRLSMTCKRLREIASHFIPEWKIYDACRRGQLLLVHNWIIREENGYYIDRAISAACSGAHILIFRLLITKGNSLDNAIYYSFRSGNVDMINEALAYSIRLIGKFCSYEAMRGACVGGHSEIVRKISKDRAPEPNNVADACRSGNIKLVKSIKQELQSDIDWNDCIYSACRSGNPDLVRYVIGKGATDFDSGLSGACKSGNSAIVKMILEHTKEPVSMADFTNACKSCTPDVISLIMDHHGSSISVNNYISMLCAAGRSDVLRTINIPSIFAILNRQTKEESLAKACPHPEVVRMILPLCDVKWNSVFKLIEYCHPESARLLINEASSSDQWVNWSILLSKSNIEGNKPLAKIILSFYSPLDSSKLMIEAASSANLSLLKIFANLGTKPDWDEIINKAAAHGCLDIVAFAANNVPNLNDALRVALHNDCKCVAEFLLSRGAKWLII